MRHLALAVLIASGAWGLDVSETHDAQEPGQEPTVAQFTRDSSADLLGLARTAKYVTTFRAQMFRPREGADSLGTPEADRLRDALLGLVKSPVVDLMGLGALAQECLESEATLGRLKMHTPPIHVAYSPDLTLQAFGEAGQRMFHQVCTDWYMEFHEADSKVVLRDGPCPVLIHRPSSIVGVMAIGERGVAEVRTATWTRVFDRSGADAARGAAGIWRRDWDGAPGAGVYLEIDASARITAAAVLAGAEHVDVSVLERVAEQALPQRTWNARLTRKGMVVEEILIGDVSHEVSNEELQIPVPRSATLVDRRAASKGAVHQGLSAWPEDIRSFVRCLDPAPSQGK